MASLDEQAVKQLSELRDLAMAHCERDVSYGDYYQGPREELHSIHARLTAAIERWTPAGSAYRDRMKAVLDDRKPDHQVISLAGVVSGLIGDIEGGYLRSVEELIHADVFSDFLEMADELLDKSYKDPAAVLVGSVLEEHLRKLATASKIEVETEDGRPIKADRLNADLAKASAYTKLEQKSIVSWLALRNEAAHGNYDKYSMEQVHGLLRDVRGFLIRCPA